MNILSFIGAQPWVRGLSSADLAYLGLQSIYSGAGDHYSNGSAEHSSSSSSSGESTRAIGDSKAQDHLSSSLDQPWAASLLGLPSPAVGGAAVHATDKLTNKCEASCLLKNASCVLLDPTSRHVIPLSSSDDRASHPATGPSASMSFLGSSSSSTIGGGDPCVPAHVYIIAPSEGPAGLLLKLGESLFLCDHTQLDSIVIRRRKSDPRAPPALSLLWPHTEVQIFVPAKEDMNVDDVGAAATAHADRVMGLFQGVIDAMSQRLGPGRFECRPSQQSHAAAKRPVEEVMTGSLDSTQKAFRAARGLLAVVDRRDASSPATMGGTESAMSTTSTYAFDARQLSRLGAEVVTHLASSVLRSDEAMLLEAEVEKGRAEAAAALDRSLRDAFSGQQQPQPGPQAETREDKRRRVEGVLARVAVVEGAEAAALALKAVPRK